MKKKTGILVAGAAAAGLIYLATRPSNKTAAQIIQGLWDSGKISDYPTYVLVYNYVTGVKTYTRDEVVMAVDQVWQYYHVFADYDIYMAVRNAVLSV